MAKGPQSRSRAVDAIETDAFNLGAFELIEPLHRGGMGEVWRGRHLESGHDVAVKVLTLDRARDRDYQAAFRNEVRAVARLDHPGIVCVYDCGEVTPPEAVSGQLPVGSPYLVMELAERGSLSGASALAEWDDVRAIVLELLGALAHAHARGVVHRDIKPGNVLRTGPKPAQVTLTDFGIAHATRSIQADLRITRQTGTPHYMAPEQVEGRVRDHGPWTDLYALGCLAYTLACGHPPFHEGDIERIMRCHLFVPAPPPVPHLAVPEGLDAWMARLLAKRPAHRFRCAADAAHTLRQLGPACVPPPVRRAPPPEGDVRTRTTVPLATLSAPRSDPVGDSALEPRDALPARAPFPADWNTTRTLSRKALLGAGRGLYGLRPIPLVDRDAERQALWRSLAAVVQSGTARAVLLVGASGVGKTRLATWLAQRAQELGAAQVLQATHSPIAGPAFGVARMLADHLACVGLEREAAFERIRQLTEPLGLPRDDDRALLELMLPAAAHAPLGAEDPPAGGPALRFSDPQERYLVVRRFLAALARERPLILLFDDVQWGADTLSFGSYLLESQPLSPIPALLVATVRDEAVAERPVERDALHELMAHESVEKLTVPPLSAADHAELVERLLGLEHALASDVAQRTRGNPLFAVQLVGDWVHRGLLVVGEHGFVLREGVEVSIPDDIHAVWVSRLDQAVRAASDDPNRQRTARTALELAAALGQDVDDEEWMAVCDAATCVPDRALLDGLLDRRLAVPRSGGWSFAHAMARESLRRLAGEAGRWRDHHRICARVLQQGRASRGTAARIGRHLLAAGDLDEAIRPLLTGARFYLLTSELRESEAVLLERERALRELGVAEADARWVYGWAIRARLMAIRGQLEDAWRLADRAVNVARRADDGEVLIEALDAIGGIANNRGSLDAGLGYFREALEHSRTLDSDAAMGRAHHGLAELSKIRGDLDASHDHYRAAIRHFEAAANSYGVANSQNGLADLLRRLGHLDEARQLVRLGLDGMSAIGNRHGVGICHNVLGEMARVSGDLDAADRHYSEAERVLAAVGSADATVIPLNLGMVRLARGDFSGAEAVFGRALTVLPRAGRHGFLAYVHVGLLPCAAHANDWSTWDAQMRLAKEALAETGLIDDDLAVMLEHAGELAAAGAPERARQAFGLALRQYEELGNATAAERLASRLY